VGGRAVTVGVGGGAGGGGWGIYEECNYMNQ
jgi:hypothetical protein